MLDSIFFVDGEIRDLHFLNAQIIDARYGYTQNLKTLEGVINDKNAAHNVVTNQLCLLDNKYTWDKRIHAPNIFMEDEDGNWKAISRFTDFKLTYVHNIEYLYKNGQFRNTVRKPRKK